MDRWTADDAGRTPLIGREAELATMIGLFKQAESGRGSAAMILGAGGVGKSRLLAEVTGRAASMGALVLTTQSSTFDSGVPYSLLSGLIDDLTDDPTVAVADIISEIQGLIGRVDGVESASRNGLVSLADQLIRRLTSVSPLLIVVDDIHLADEDSLALLTRLSRTIGRTRTMLLGAARTRGAFVSSSLPDLVAFLEKAELGAVIGLTALDASETRSVIREILGAMPSEDLLQFVFDQSRGSPFFTSEVVRTLEQSGRIRIVGARAHLLDGDRVLQPKTSLIHRFFEVGGDDTQVARVLSVFGQIEIRRLGAIAAVSGFTEEHIRRCFDRLVSAGLLYDDGRGVFTFSHSLLREALYDDIGPAEQRRLHRAIAAFLQAEGKEGARVDVSDLATHVAASAEVGDEEAIRILVEAGRQAGPLAPLVAASWYERAARLSVDGSGQWAALTAERAHALFRASRPVETAKIAERALEALEPGPLRDRTICDVVNSMYIAGDLGGAITFVESLGDVSQLPLSVQAQHEHFRAQWGTPEPGPCDHFVGTRSSLGAQEMVTLAHDLFHASLIDRHDVVRAGIERLEVLRPHANERQKWSVDSFLSFVHLTSSDFDQVKRCFVDRPVNDVNRSNMSLGGLLEASNCILQFVEGRWDEALIVADDVLSQMEIHGIRIVESFLRTVPCRVAIERGDLRTAKEIIPLLSTPAHGMKPTVEAVVAHFDRITGHADRSVERLETLLARRREISITISDFVILQELALCFDALGDKRRAQKVADRLRDEWSGSDLPYVRCQADLGFGTIRRDAESLQRSLMNATDHGYVFEEAKSRLLLGELGVDARVNLERARHIFDGLGAVPWRQQAQAGLRRLGVGSTQRSTKAVASLLSDAEREIARLVAQGMTNKEIAGSLHYSVKTVEVYLTRIYAKTACSSRLELARAVDRGEVVLA